MITIETWQMILVGFLAICGGFHTIYVAGEHLSNIIKNLRKPSDDIKNRLDSQDQKLANDNKRLKDLEDAVVELAEIITEE